MKPLQRALAIESNVARIIGNQSYNGVEFDLTRAKFYVHVLEEKTLDLYRKVRPHLDLEVLQPYDGPVNKPFLISGKYSKNTIKWYPDVKETHLVTGPFSRVEFVEPNLGKRAKLIEQLLKLGWKPAEYTKTTEKGGGNNPKITVDDPKGGKMICPSLYAIIGTVGSDVAMWYTLKHRQSQIKGLIDLVRSDGRIEAAAHTIGTPTYRFRHAKVVNIPKAAKFVIFGRQMRSLFTVKCDDLHKRINGRRNFRRRYNMVGHDASGLELRVLAHYTDDEEFTREVSEGDIHSKNQGDAGLPTRDAAKTFIYAFIYGAGTAKLGSIVGGGMAAGKQIKSKFLAANPKLKQLIERVQRAAGKGYVLGIDRRRVRIRRDPVTNKPQVHKGLNALLQTGGALVMKYSMVWLDQAVTQEGLDVTKVIDMHDEAQAEVSKEDTQRYAWLAEESIRVAGRYLEMRCPLDAEAKVGKRWSETH